MRRSLAAHIGKDSTVLKLGIELYCVFLIDLLFLYVYWLCLNK